MFWLTFIFFIFVFLPVGGNNLSSPEVVGEMSSRAWAAMISFFSGALPSQTLAVEIEGESLSSNVNPSTTQEMI